MDKTTKCLLAAIAAGLFANAIVRADAGPKADYIVTGDELRSIAAAIESIANGTCSNRKLCGGN